MIVDDNPSFLAAARTMLERDGVTVLATCSSGAEAVRAVTELQPDVVLIDVSLGEESGFDLARRLRQDNRSARAAIIMTSTHSRAELLDLIERSPAGGFIAKSDLSRAAISDQLDPDRDFDEPPDT